MALESFAPPGNATDLRDRGRRAWSRELDQLFEREAHGDPDGNNDSPRSQFFDPIGVELAADAATRVMRWGAFPRKLARLPAPQRWELGEERDRQEEYCEWFGQRDNRGRLVRASFTTEVPGYYHLLAADDPERLLDVYRGNVSDQVELRDLIGPSGAYRERNTWNLEGAMHMVQPSNTLPAAVVLVAQSTIVRRGSDGPMTNANDLIRCGVAADPDRNSDPLLVGEVNALARAGAEITLADPVGLYLDTLQTEGWVTPDGSDPQAFWRLTRGDAEHALRGVYEVPDDLGYTIGDIKINGQPIISPSQIAEGIEVKVSGVAHRFGSSQQAPRGCANERSLGLGAARRGVGPGDELPSLASLLAAARETR
jgi:hypothetical protein